MPKKRENNSVFDGHLVLGYTTHAIGVGFLPNKQLCKRGKQHTTRKPRSWHRDGVYDRD